MPLGKFINTTTPACTPPLLDQSFFGTTGGYQPGRYCGLGSFEDGTTCCFPCPVQDWVYPPHWKQQLRVPNYLSILSIILCSFLLLSFAVLPPAKTHRHYLSVGLLFPVLAISLSFVIPVAVDPPLCYDAITPNDMRSSLSCAWTGALVTFGGLGSVIWVFIRSLWLHIRIVWDKDPGRKFKWGSIIAGTLLPLTFLVSLLSATGFSYRMGQTCLPNHEHAIVTFWAWLVSFAIAGFLLQAITTGYCFIVYARTWRRERRRLSESSFQRGRNTRKLETWKNVKKLFVLQWRNVLVSVFVLIGSIAFFIVFWTQDSKLGRVFNDPKNIRPVKTWLICQTLSRGNKEECRKYVKNFTVSQASVLVSLILASLVGIEIFILLFRPSMIHAWRDLFGNLFHRTRLGRPSSPQLTSLDDADKYQAPSPPPKTPYSSKFSENTTPSTVSDPNERSSTLTSDNIKIGMVLRPQYQRMTSQHGLLIPEENPTSNFEQPHLVQSFFDAPSAEGSRTATPMQFLNTREAPKPPVRAASNSNSKQPVSEESNLPRASSLSWATNTTRNKSAKKKPRISQPVPGSFVHVASANVDAGLRDLTDAEEKRP